MITVSIIPESGRLAVRVADTGRGIDEKSLPHIFDRFYRGEEPRGGGAGLGLAIVAAIVVAHGGRVELRTGPGVGAAFRVLLPGDGEAVA